MTSKELTELYRQNSKAKAEDGCIIYPDICMKFLSHEYFASYVGKENYSKVTVSPCGNTFELQYIDLDGIKAIYVIL